MSERDEPDPFPEASVPETRQREVSPDALSAPRSGAPAVPPSEAPTLPLIPVDRLRFQTGGDSGSAAPSDSPEAAPAVEREAAPSVEREADLEVVAISPAAASPLPSPSAAAPPPPAAPRDLVDRRQPLYRECQGYRLRLDPADLARLRELAGSRGRSDDEIGEAFFDGQADRFAESLAGDVPVPSEIRVIVDPYSRQAFLALENRIRGILSF